MNNTETQRSLHNIENFQNRERKSQNLAKNALAVLLGGGALMLGGDYVLNDFEFTNNIFSYFDSEDTINETDDSSAVVTDIPESINSVEEGLDLPSWVSVGVVTEDDMDSFIVESDIEFDWKDYFTLINSNDFKLSQGQEELLEKTFASTDRFPESWEINPNEPVKILFYEAKVAENGKAILGLSDIVQNLGHNTIAIAATVDVSVLDNLIPQELDTVWSGIYEEILDGSELETVILDYYNIESIDSLDSDQERIYGILEGAIENYELEDIGGQNLKKYLINVVIEDLDESTEQVENNFEKTLIHELTHAYADFEGDVLDVDYVFSDDEDSVERMRIAYYIDVLAPYDIADFKMISIEGGEFTFNAKNGAGTEIEVKSKLFTELNAILTAEKIVNGELDFEKMPEYDFVAQRFYSGLNDLLSKSSQEITEDQILEMFQEALTKQDSMGYFLNYMTENFNGVDENELIGFVFNMSVQTNMLVSMEVK